MRGNKPEPLKGLPKDRGFFLCNIYYREFEQQQQVRGVGNSRQRGDEVQSCKDLLQYIASTVETRRICKQIDKGTAMALRMGEMADVKNNNFWSKQCNIAGMGEKLFIR